MGAGVSGRQADQAGNLLGVIRVRRRVSSVKWQTAVIRFALLPLLVAVILVGIIQQRPALAIGAALVAVVALLLRRSFDRPHAARVPRDRSREEETDEDWRNAGF